MLDAAFHHRCNGQKVTAVPLLLSWGLPEEVLADSFLIFAEDGRSSGMGLQELLPTPGKELGLVFTDEFSGTDGMARLLHEAVFMIRSDLERKGQLEIYNSLHSAVERMVDLDENARSSEGLTDLFIHDFREWLRREHRVAVFLPKGEDAEVKNPKKVLFFRQDYLLLSKEAFDQLLLPMDRRSIPQDHVKASLAQKGILKCEECGSYQVKIRYGKDGRQTIRGYKLALQQLDDPDNGFRVLDWCKR